mmetsp:Transcript_1028/g.1315  ORF Transcript_1028/g.1315 Transcript_1028/m.1315 type:complete len:145 (-) Transcript_1028:597-1031(-)
MFSSQFIFLLVAAFCLVSALSSNRNLLFGDFIEEACAAEIVAIDWEVCECPVFVDGFEWDICSQPSWYELVSEGGLSAEDASMCLENCPGSDALVDCYAPLAADYYCGIETRKLRGNFINAPFELKRLVRKEGSKVMMHIPRLY